MSISKAIINKDKHQLKAAVEEAVKIYKAEMPDVPKVETIHGPMDVTMAAAIDEDIYWGEVIRAYYQITTKCESIDKKDDRRVEIAKLVATNAILRNLTSDNSTVYAGGERIL